MKAHCEHCRTLREMDYPTSVLNDGLFTIGGVCSVCGSHLEQKKKILLADLTMDARLAMYAT